MIEDKISLALKDIAKIKAALKEIKKDMKVEEKGKATERLEDDLKQSSNLPCGVARIEPVKRLERVTPLRSAFGGVSRPTPSLRRSKSSSFRSLELLARR